MDVDRAYELIERAVKNGRVANAYLLVGGVRGMAGALAERVLHLLFGPGDLRVHPDIHRLMPEKKSRIISVAAMRERMIEPMEKTTFMGGWKAGVVLGADRLKAESANAFLKTLEEPPPHTLFLLLSERPEQLLPTIVSRCQRIDLPDARAQQLEEPYRTQVLDVLASNDLTGITARAAAAAQLAAVLAALKDLAEARVQEDLEEDSSNAGEELDDDAVNALVSSRYREFRAGRHAREVVRRQHVQHLRAVRFLELLRARVRQVDALAARDDRGKKLLGPFGKEQEERVRGRLLERLQEGVRALGAETVRPQHHAGLPAAHEGGLLHRLDHAFAHGLHGDDARLLRGHEPVDVGMDAQVARAEEQMEHAVRKFARHAAHTAHEQVGVCGAAHADGPLDQLVGPVNVHARPR